MASVAGADDLVAAQQLVDNAVAQQAAADAKEDAAEERMRMIEFPCTFTSDEEKLKEEQSKADASRSVSTNALAPRVACTAERGDPVLGEPLGGVVANHHERESASRAGRRVP